MTTFRVFFVDAEFLLKMYHMDTVFIRGPQVSTVGGMKGGHQRAGAAGGQTRSNFNILNFFRQNLIAVF